MIMAVSTSSLRCLPSVLKASRLPIRVLTEHLDRTSHHNQLCLLPSLFKQAAAHSSSSTKDPGGKPEVAKLLDESVTTTDEKPLTVGNTQSVAQGLSNMDAADNMQENERSKKKPRHAPKTPSLEPTADYSNKSVLLFPGQGSQFIGMGKKVLEVPSVRELFSDASQILGYDLLKLCLEGPKSVLDETQHCQAATVVCSLAAVEYLYQNQPDAVENCMAAAGFSVGEITALIFSGALSFSEGINLVKIRGELMKSACDLERSGLMTVFFGADNKLGFGMQVAEEWCRRNHNIEFPVCKVANHLYCGAKVVGGHEEALAFLEKNKADFKIRRTRRLPVSGAFHTPLMDPAVEPFKEALKNTRLSDPRIPIYSNINNTIYTKSHQILRMLPKQLSRPVKWESSMSSLFKFGPNDQLPNVYECGPGKSLSAILEKINGRAAKQCQFIPV